MSNVTINVSVIGERLTLTNQPVLASGTIKAVQIQFTFDEAWDGYSKIALFWDESGEVYAWQVVNDLATVPHEVVVSAGRLSFGVYGVKGTYRIVTEKIMYDIADGAYTSVYDGSTEPTPGIIDQIEAQLAAQGTSIQTLQTQMALTRESVSNLGADMDNLRVLSLAAYPMDSAEGRMASFSDGAAGLPLKALTVDIVPVQAGSGTASPTNARAIRGVTAVAVTRCGKNLLNPSDAEIGRAWNGSTATSRARLVVPCRPNTAYTLSASGVSTLSNIYVTNTASVPASSAGAEITSRMPFTMTTKADAKYIVVAFSKENIAQEDIDALNLQLELGSAATEYEPYSGDNYDIVVPQNVGTVYGGRLDVVNGILTINYKALISTFGELTVGAGTPPSGYVLKRFDELTNDFPAETWLTDTVCNIAIASNTSYANNVIRFSNDRRYCILTLPSDLDSSTPVVVVYPLESPKTYPIDPALISTLLGNNTIYADCGDVTVTYRADPTLFSTHGQTEDNMIANSAIASGRYFQIGNTLYRATAAIATGETIVPGGNCAVTNLAEALNLLNE